MIKKEGPCNSHGTAFLQPQSRHATRLEGKYTENQPQCKSLTPIKNRRESLTAREFIVSPNLQATLSRPPFPSSEIIIRSSALCEDQQAARNNLQLGLTQRDRHENVYMRPSEPLIPTVLLTLGTRRCWQAVHHQYRPRYVDLWEDLLGPM